MDLTTTTPPDADNETPPQIHPLKSLSFTNGAFNHQHHHLAPPPLTAAAKVVVTYKECQRNHAAAMGGHALDGCGEFMPSSAAAAAADPASLKCAACGCHRNFHRRDPEEPAAVFLDFRRRAPVSLSPSPSPPPVASYYSPSAPQMLLSLRTAAAPAPEDHPAVNPATPTAAKAENPSGRKRFRTKFSREQKEKMHSFSEKLGWKMQRSDEGIVEEFCNEIGVGKGVLKVWMHNNKHTFGKKDIINGGNSTATTAINGGGVISSDSSGQINLPPNVVVNGRHHDMDDHHNGSSSS